MNLPRPTPPTLDTNAALAPKGSFPVEAQTSAHAPAKRQDMTTLSHEVSSDAHAPIDVVVPWCSPNGGSVRSFQDLSPPMLLPVLSNPQWGIRYAFTRAPALFNGRPMSALEDPTSCNLALLHASMMRESFDLTLPAAARPITLPQNATQLPALPARQFYSYDCVDSQGLYRGPMFSIDLMPRLVKTTTADGAVSAYAAFVSLDQANVLHPEACSTGQYAHAVVHTFRPGLNPEVFLGIFHTQDAAPITAYEPLGQWPQASALPSAQATRPHVTLNFAGDSTINTFLVASPVVSDAMAGASLALFSLGALALIARKVMVGRRPPEQAQGQGAV